MEKEIVATAAAATVAASSSSPLAPRLRMAMQSSTEGWDVGFADHAVAVQALQVHVKAPQTMQVAEHFFG